MTPLRQHRRKLQGEALEPRYALNGDGDFLQNAQSLTLSFVPDGTRVTGTPSSLAQTFAAKIPNWQEVVVRAFQTWAQSANINVGVVRDGGEPLGFQGQSHLDARFGDIRIAGVPLALDTYGEAIHETRMIVGTWSGDVVFNTNAPINTEAELFSVAVHEAGHVLGLEHSTDPLSPMFKHGISTTAGPTANDVAALQAAYGNRRADVHDAAQPNDSIQRATRIPHSEPVDGFNGTTPLVIYGDLLNGTDKDVYELPVLPGYGGSLSIDLVTRGISELAGRLTILDRDGHVLAQTAVAGRLGDKVTALLSSIPVGKLYFQIDSPSVGLFGSGAYAVVTRYDQLLTTPASVIDQKVLDGFHWQARTDDGDGQVDIRQLLTSGSIKLNDDQHQDDSISTSVTLREVIDSNQLRKFQVVGTITDVNDVDSYRLRSQSSPATGRGLTVTIESLEHEGLIPSLTLFDKTGATMPVQVVVRGNGQLTVRAEGIEDNKDYFVRVGGSGGSLGNYSLVARFDEVQLSRESVLTGQLNATMPVVTAQLYVARPQLFSFALSSVATSTSHGAIWVSVIDDAHRNVAFLGSEVGQFRSAAAVLLQPGTYSLFVEGRDEGTGGPIIATFTVFADGVSDPVGPPIIEPGTQPAFSCNDLSGLFCFPALPPTSEPVVITAPTAPNDFPGDVPLTVPPDFWFWGTDFSPTNPLQPLDTNGDTKITAFDALGIINHINLYGVAADPIGPRMSGYLDVNSDGRISAFDALAVINHLNTHPLAAGSGGEAVHAPMGEAIGTEERIMLFIQAAEQVIQRPRERALRAALAALARS